MKTLKFSVVLFGCTLFLLSGCQKSLESELPGSEIQVSEKYSSAVNSLLAQVRDATDQYHDPAVAIADGYVNVNECVSGPPGEGAMGFHFVKFSAVDGIYDPLEPEALLYEKKNNGQYKLVAVEYLFVGTTAPEFANEIHFHPLPLPVADYALHAWIWKGNPAGVFEDFNVNVSCP